MLVLFDFGELLVETLDKIGDFLLSDPAPFISSISGLIVGFFDALGLHYGADLISEYFASDLSIATLILGPALIAILSLRLIKFFVDFF
jgi:hypothetical protein